MAIDFPASPTLNQEYTFGTKTWVYNGTGWAAKQVPGYVGSIGATGYTGSIGYTGSKGAAAFTKSASAPASSNIGDYWLNQDTGKLYVYINGGSANAWMEYGPNDSFVPNISSLDGGMPNTNFTNTTVDAGGV